MGLVAPLSNPEVAKFNTLGGFGLYAPDKTRNEPSEVSQDIASTDGRIFSDTPTAGPSSLATHQTTPESDVPPKESKVTKGAYGASCNHCRSGKRACVRDTKGAPCKRCRLKMATSPTHVCTNKREVKKPGRPPGILNGQGKGKGKKKDAKVIIAPVNRENMQEDSTDRDAEEGEV
ncbi:hypothetical protein OBBRIDRAFT_19077 [Obba rivulosa]|uniref:Zn(2)-C6 fungal-type domain-containing protein n=1 Tax=Obba rivulosa TaxID=1052685 RepID=A0A8E2DW08_9APHY|nr:hypothetical protein OBBRIDRAFT_19077 [Obba rivulosa]